MNAILLNRQDSALTKDANNNLVINDNLKINGNTEIGNNTLIADNIVKITSSNAEYADNIVNAVALGGTGLNVQSSYQTVVGKYNNPEPEAVFVVGNGTTDNLKSAFIVGNGNIQMNSPTTVNSTFDIGEEQNPGQNLTNALTNTLLKTTTYKFATYGYAADDFDDEDNYIGNPIITLNKQNITPSEETSYIKILEDSNSGNIAEYLKTYKNNCVISKFFKDKIVNIFFNDDTEDSSIAIPQESGPNSVETTIYFKLNQDFSFGVIPNEDPKNDAIFTLTFTVEYNPETKKYTLYAGRKINTSDSAGAITTTYKSVFDIALENQKDSFNAAGIYESVTYMEAPIVAAIEQILTILYAQSNTILVYDGGETRNVTS